MTDAPAKDAPSGMSPHTSPSGASPHTPPSAARERLRGKRIALVAVIAVAVTFVGASAAQIIPAVFGAGTKPLPPGPPGSSARVCAEGVRTLLRAMADDAPGTVEPPGQRDAWGPSAEACGQSPEGLDAWAALLRLREARAQLVSRTDPAESGRVRARAELDPLRHEVAEHLPADLR
jgi:hypothetical protein